jgi:hypothetical protein
MIAYYDLYDAAFYNRLQHPTPNEVDEISLHIHHGSDCLHLATEKEKLVLTITSQFTNGW